MQSLLVAFPVSLQKTSPGSLEPEAVVCQVVPAAMMRRMTLRPAIRYYSTRRLSKVFLNLLVPAHHCCGFAGGRDTFQPEKFLPAMVKIRFSEPIADYDWQSRCAV